MKKLIHDALIGTLAFADFRTFSGMSTEVQNGVSSDDLSEVSVSASTDSVDGDVDCGADGRCEGSAEI